MLSFVVPVDGGRKQIEDTLEVIADLLEESAPWHAPTSTLLVVEVVLVYRKPSTRGHNRAEQQTIDLEKHRFSLIGVDSFANAPLGATAENLSFETVSITNKA